MLLVSFSRIKINKYELPKVHMNIDRQLLGNIYCFIQFISDINPLLL